MGMGHSRLFIPGPVEVSPDVLDAMSVPMIGHRTSDFSDLFNSAVGKLGKVMMTDCVCLISASSGSGFMEAAIRNCVRDKVLNTICGAFSSKWHDIAARCGKETGKVEVDWGMAVKPDMVRKKLEDGGYDAVCVTHNETTTGVSNPVEDISKVIARYPDTLLFVDAVSSLGGMKVDTDRLGIDFCLSSSQKALGLPPGISVAAVSDDAFDRAEGIEGRGYYFDILELKKMHAKGMTPYTPSISHIKALDVQLGRILSEGIENRFFRHARLADISRKWAIGKGFEIFAEKGYESDTVTCITNTLGVDLKKMQSMMAERGYGMDAGYRKLNDKLVAEGKPTTFRIAHMGDMTADDLRDFLDALDEVLAKMEVA